MLLFCFYQRKKNTIGNNNSTISTAFSKNEANIGSHVKVHVFFVSKTEWNRVKKKLCDSRAENEKVGLNEKYKSNLNSTLILIEKFKMKIIFRKN